MRALRTPSPAVEQVKKTYSQRCGGTITRKSKRFINCQKAQDVSRKKDLLKTDPLAVFRNESSYLWQLIVLMSAIRNFFFCLVWIASLSNFSVLTGNAQPITDDDLSKVRCIFLCIVFFS